MKRSLWGLALACGCAGSTPAPTTPEIESLPVVDQVPEDPSVTSVSRPEQTPGYGGRLFDRWYAAADVTFVPDDPETEALDGQGGPFGNGTLPGADGEPMPNPGHDYRFKNLFGWDLRGSQGIYGPEHLDKPGVMVPSLLDDTDTRAHWIARLTHGGDAFPAYGKALAPEDIEALVDFLLGVRDGQLPRPDDLYTLNAHAPNHYSLKPGADAERGDALFAERCATCHGDDGTKRLFDDGAHSLGTLARTKAYEVAMKILSGQPGTDMVAQVQGDAQNQAQDIRDLLAALCDRERYPKGGATHPDVPDDDPRCGPALK